MLSNLCHPWVREARVLKCTNLLDDLIVSRVGLAFSQFKTSPWVLVRNCKDYIAKEFYIYIQVFNAKKQIEHFLYGKVMMFLSVGWVHIIVVGLGFYVLGGYRHCWVRKNLWLRFSLVRTGSELGLVFTTGIAIGNQILY
jgi:hypothetical protein